MKNTADIRKDNKKNIYRMMLDGQSYTKHQISVKTGLSVATCNTLLNDMANDGILEIADEKQLRGVGRGSSLFKIHDKHESYLLMNFTLDQNVRVVELYVVSALKDILYEKKIKTEQFEIRTILSIIEQIMQTYRQITQCIVSVPGVVRDSIVTFSDFIELNTFCLKDELEKVLNIPFVIESDMHVIACGYNKKSNEENVVSIAGFHENYYPGTVTMHKGQIISGFAGIAGMAGMLLDDDPKKCMNKSNCEKEIFKVLRSIIVMLNPNEIILYGNLVDSNMLFKIQTYFEKIISKEYIPDFKIDHRMDSYLIDGLFEIAINKKMM